MSTCVDESDLLEVVNRSKSYKLSKKILCSSIPYFEKMFCCDLLESKQNKVTMDLDESAFNNILSYVYSNSFLLNIGNVLQTYDCCEYLMIDDLQKECSQFFYDNFNIEYMPIILQSVGDCSKLITPKIINCFICRHFLKISNTRAFYTFPLDVIEFICSLDLVVDSEYQVFDAIKRWIEFDLDGGRRNHIKQLMMLIRWCYISVGDLDKIKQDKLVLNSTKFLEILCLRNECKNDCTSTRVITNPAITINAVDEFTIDILISDGPSYCFPCGHFKADETLSTSIIIEENVSDLFYDSGRKGIRVDWRNKKFKYLNMIGSSDSYYNQLFKYIMYSFERHPSMNVCKWNLRDSIEEFTCESLPYKNMLFDHGGVFIGIGHENGHDNRVYFFSGVTDKTWLTDQFSTHPSSHACLIKDKVYIINQDLEMIEVNTTYRTLKKTKTLNTDAGFSFNDIKLFNHGDKLLLCQTITKKIYVYNLKAEKWSLLCDFKTPKDLIAISSNYSPNLEMNMLFTVK